MLSREGRAARSGAFALEQLAEVEKVFTAAGRDIVLIEPIGLNIWKDPVAVGDDGLPGALRARHEFPPPFPRRAARSSSRTQRDGVEKEISISPATARPIAVESFANCYWAGLGGAAVQETLAAVNTKYGRSS